MASFKGTKKEFRRYIGPRQRNLVHQITQKHRKHVGSCEHCGATTELEAAHIRGRNRNQIIELLLAPMINDGIATLDIEEFERAFKFEHQPLEKAILILCRSCHTSYDAKLATKKANIEKLSSAMHARDPLPISLEPANPDMFKEQLLKQRQAEMEIHYQDGKVEIRPWVANRFGASSKIFGNLRSRPEFRAGEWQARGIVKVHVVIKHA